MVVDSIWHRWDLVREVQENLVDGLVDDILVLYLQQNTSRTVDNLV